MQLLKIQLYVNQNPILNEDAVSEKYHIFLDDLSFCKKICQDTEFFETDMCLPYQNLMKLPTEKLNELVKENKQKICYNCYKNFAKWIKEENIQDLNQNINLYNN